MNRGAAPAGPGHRVAFVLPDGRTETLRVAAGAHILDAARQAGITLPSLCQQGWCCTCAVRVLSGRVEQSDSRRYFDADRDAGFALICTGRALSDLRLATHALPLMRQHRIAAGLPVPRGPTLPV